jgi:hypothetical protein
MDHGLDNIGDESSSANKSNDWIERHREETMKARLSIGRYRRVDN